MAVIRPVIYTPIEDIEVLRNRTVSEEVVRKMIQNCNMFKALAPVGTIRCIALNQLGVMTPSADQWQQADGSEITNPISPIGTLLPDQRYTPDLRNVYLRGSADDSSNTPGGGYTVDLQHSHSSGVLVGTGFGEEGTEQQAYHLNHGHAIPPDLSVTEPLEPAHQEVAVYIKIN